MDLTNQSALPAVGDLLRVFLSGRSPATLRTYAAGLEDFRRFVSAASVDEACRTLLAGGHGAANRMALGWRADLLNRRLAPATVNNRLAALRSVVKLAGLLGLVPWRLEVPSVRAESYRDTQGPGREAVRGMMARLSASASGSVKARRDLAMVRLLHDVALRRAEVTTLDLADVDLSAGAVFVLRKGKREKVRLCLPAATVAAVAAWVRDRGEAPGPLFVDLSPGGGGRLSGTSVYRLVRDLGRAVNVRTRPHGLRHAGITRACERAAEAGIGVEEVLAYSGHADLRTLLVYRDRLRNVQGQLAAMVAED